MRRGIVIVHMGITRRFRRFDPGCIERITVFAPLDSDGPVLPPPFVLALFPPLDPFEIREHVVIRPAERALLRPAVVIGRISA